MSISVRSAGKSSRSWCALSPLHPKLSVPTAAGRRLRRLSRFLGPNPRALVVCPLAPVLHLAEASQGGSLPPRDLRATKRICESKGGERHGTWTRWRPWRRCRTRWRSRAGSHGGSQGGRTRRQVCVPQLRPQSVSPGRTALLSNDLPQVWHKDGSRVEHG